MRRLLCEFLHDQTGATAIEYGLIVTLLALAIVGGVSHAANSLVFLWSNNNSLLVQAFN